MSYGKVKETFWTDSSGKERPVPRAGSRLRPADLPDHAALRAFVFIRDDFTCKKCGHRPERVPENYDGRSSWFSIGSLRRGEKRTDLHIDHIHPRSRGGTNHPDNLQTLCFPCNAGKRDRISA